MSESAPPPPTPRRFRRRPLCWILGGSILLIPLAIGVLWILVHTIPWMGPFVANTLRSVIGRDNVTRLEDFAYSVEDRINRTFKTDTAPQAHWEIPEPIVAPAPELPPEEEPSAEEQTDPPLAPFLPADPGPVYPDFSAPGDGRWLPLSDPRRPDESPRMMKTLLHPDKSRSWAELFVVAVDLRQVDLRLMAGYQEPRTEKKEAEGYERKSKIPPEHYDALLGAFNGGFMAEHGRYGFFLDGITFLDPKEDACTLAYYKDGSYRIATWSKIAEQRAEMLWFRQAPSCMYEDGSMHPSLRGAHHKKWGATLDGNTVIRRSAVGLSEDGQIFYVGITNHTTARVLAQGMHHAGAHHVAQMDVNWSYPKFVTYEPDKKDRLVPIALAQGFEFNEHLYLRERSMRDFFYLVRKEEIAPSTPSGHATPPEQDSAPSAEEPH